MTEKKKNNYIPYIGLHILLFVYSFGGIYSKTAAGEEFLSFRFIFFYGLLILNLFIYAVFWQQIIKRIPLTTACANKGITIIWGFVLGRIVFGETVTLLKIIGSAVIIAGIVLVVTDDEK